MPAFALVNGSNVRAVTNFTDWFDAADGLRTKARNAESLCRVGLITPVPYELGLFYGKNRHKIFYPQETICHRGDANKWIEAALEEIGDQSSIPELIERAILRGYTFKRADLDPNSIGSMAFWFTDTKFELPFDTFREKVKDKITYINAAQSRARWRVKNGLKTDCRTYEGQPGRNMIRQQAKDILKSGNYRNN
jgi:hypothetical protein